MHTLLAHILVYNVFTHRSIYSIANKSVFLTMPWEYGTYVKNTQYFFSQQTLKHIFILKLPLISYQPNLKILHACYKYIFTSRLFCFRWNSILYICHLWWSLPLVFCWVYSNICITVPNSVVQNQHRNWKR